MKMSANSNAYSEIRIKLAELVGKTELANADVAEHIYLKSVSMTLGDKIEG